MHRRLRPRRSLDLGHHLADRHPQRELQRMAEVVGESRRCASCRSCRPGSERMGRRDGAVRLADEARVGRPAVADLLAAELDHPVETSPAKTSATRVSLTRGAAARQEHAARASREPRRLTVPGWDFFSPLDARLAMRAPRLHLRRPLRRQGEQPVEARHTSAPRACAACRGRRAARVKRIGGRGAARTRVQAGVERGRCARPGRALDQLSRARAAVVGALALLGRARRPAPPPSAQSEQVGGGRRGSIDGGFSSSARRGPPGRGREDGALSSARCGSGGERLVHRARCGGRPGSPRPLLVHQREERRLLVAAGAARVPRHVRVARRSASEAGAYLAALPSSSSAVARA